jgi:hypothetical protein
MFEFQCLTGRDFLFSVTHIPALRVCQWVRGDSVPGVKWPSVMTNNLTNSTLELYNM